MPACSLRLSIAAALLALGTHAAAQSAAAPLPLIPLPREAAAS